MDPSKGQGIVVMLRARRRELSPEARSSRQGPKAEDNPHKSCSRFVVEIKVVDSWQRKLSVALCLHSRGHACDARFIHGERKKALVLQCECLGKEGETSEHESTGIAIKTGIERQYLYKDLKGEGSSPEK